MAGMAAGCQAVGLLSYREAEREEPRALVGMTDLSARKYTRSALGQHALSFTVPWQMILRMEEDVDDSFLQRETWQTLLGDPSHHEESV